MREMREKRIIEEIREKGKKVEYVMKEEGRKVGDVGKRKKDKMIKLL